MAAELKRSQNGRFSDSSETVFRLRLRCNQCSRTVEVLVMKVSQGVTRRYSDSTWQLPADNGWKYDTVFSWREASQTLKDDPINQSMCQEWEYRRENKQTLFKLANSTWQVKKEIHLSILWDRLWLTERQKGVTNRSTQPNNWGHSAGSWWRLLTLKQPSDRV